jgi:DHA1 family bicyclomycin/chloramphenicol resistance-like MFS transporter
MKLNPAIKRHRSLIVLLIGALNTITPFSIDMYLPGFSQIAKDFATDTGKVAVSVSTYFLGFALGQLLYGPLLDRFGRKRPLYIGLSIYIVITLACIVAPSINAFLVLRFFQALSGCVASVAAMAIVVDMYPGNKSSRILSMMVLILGMSPLLAPSIGTAILSVGSWHSVFVVLAAIAALLLLCSIFFLPETHKPEGKISLLPKHITGMFVSILRDPRFYIYSLSGSLAFTGLFCYVAGSPALFMEYFHLSPGTYGIIFAALSIGFIGGSQLVHFLSKRFLPGTILKTALICQAIAATTFFIITAILKLDSLMVVIGFLFVILSMVGLSYPNAASLALGPFAKNAGAASALLGSIQIGLGALFSAVVGLLPFKGTFSLALVMAVTAVAATMLIVMGKRKSLSILTADADHRR